MWGEGGKEGGVWGKGVNEECRREVWREGIQEREVWELNDGRRRKEGVGREGGAHCFQLLIEEKMHFGQDRGRKTGL